MIDLVPAIWLSRWGSCWPRQLSVGCRKPPEPLNPDAKAQETGTGSRAHVPLKELAVDLDKGVKLEMVLIPAGEFLMGSPDSDKDADAMRSRSIGFGSPSRSIWASTW